MYAFLNISKLVISSIILPYKKHRQPFEQIPKSCLNPQIITQKLFN